jgi:hypothetical protein
MEITLRALSTLIHGMLFCAFFLMATYGLVVELYRSGHEEQPSKIPVISGIGDKESGVSSDQGA